MRFFRRRFSGMWRKRRGGRRGASLLLIFFALFLLVTGIVTLRRALLPALAELAEAGVHGIGSRAINNAIIEQIEADSIDYDCLMTLEKDLEGRITALKTNMIEVNRFKARLMEHVLIALEELEPSTLGIPMGNLTGVEFFSGRGPKIPIRVIPYGTADSQYINSFEAAGINQTRHQILMEVSVDMSVLLPWYETHTTISTRVTIAETVIVGSVPEAYTYLEDAGWGRVDIAPGKQ